MATIYEVAALAKVSPATVSRVYNGVPVSDDKSERVRAAAAELNFTPNRTARRLRRRSSEVIGLVIADIENPFFTSMARGVEDAANAAGFSVVLCNSDEDSSKESRYLDVALSENMAGVILAPANDHPALGPLLDRKVPIVAVDRTASGFDIDSVLFDNVNGARLATETLYDQGFSRVACITGPAGVGTAEERADGWRTAFETRSAGIDPGDYLIHADFRIDGGRAALTALLDSNHPPDAVVITNNLMSVGAMQELLHRGLNPDSFGLASFGELPLSPLSNDNVTVVHTESRRLGSLAAELLLARISGDHGPTKHTVVPASVTAGKISIGGPVG
jgi:LacI family transcriptional regulator